MEFYSGLRKGVWLFSILLVGVCGVGCDLFLKKNDTFFSSTSDLISIIDRIVHIIYCR